MSVAPMAGLKHGPSTGDKIRRLSNVWIIEYLTIGKGSAPKLAKYPKVGLGSPKPVRIAKVLVNVNDVLNGRWVTQTPEIGVSCQSGIGL